MSCRFCLMTVLLMGGILAVTKLKGQDLTGSDPRNELQQLTTQLQQSPGDQALREKIIALALALNPTPATPDPATMAEGAAEYAFNNAKGNSDFSDAAKQYEKALLLAPWLAADYFNCGIAHEKAGENKEAIRNFNLYLLAAPNADDAQTVKKRIGGLQYATQKAADTTNTKVVAASADETKYGWLQGEWSYKSVYLIRGNTYYGDASGVAKVTKLGNIVEIGPINDYGRAIGDLRASVNESGNTSWEFRFVTEYRGECGYGKRSPVNVTIGQDQRTIRFQVDTYSGVSCEYAAPFIVVLTRM